MKKIISFFALIISIFVLFSCNNNSPEPNDDFKLLKDTIVMYVGDTEKILYEGTANFMSANESIAKVDSNGNVTGVSEGNTTIIANLASNPSKVQVKVIKKTISEEKYRNGNIKLKFVSPLFNYDDMLDAKFKLSSNVYNDDLINFKDFKFDFNLDLTSDSTKKDANINALKDILGLHDGTILSFLNIEFPTEYMICYNGLQNMELNDLHIDFNNLDGISFMIYNNENELLYLGNNSKENSSSIITTILKILDDMNYDFELLQQLSFNTIISRFLPGDKELVNETTSEEIRKYSLPILGALNVLTGGININKVQVDSNTYKFIITLNEYGKTTITQMLTELVPEEMKAVLGELIKINDFKFEVVFYQELKNSHNHLKELGLLIDIGLEQTELLNVDLALSLDSEFKNDSKSFDTQSTRNKKMYESNKEFNDSIKYVIPLLEFARNDRTYNLSLLKSDQDSIKAAINGINNLSEANKLLIKDSYDENLMDKYTSVYSRYENAINDLENVESLSDINNILSQLTKYKDLFNAIKTDYPTIYQKIKKIETDEINELENEIKANLLSEEELKNLVITDNNYEANLAKLDSNILSQEKISKLLSYDSIIIDEERTAFLNLINSYNDISDQNIKLYNKILTYTLNKTYDDVSNISKYVIKLAYGYNGKNISSTYFLNKVKQESIYSYKYSNLAKGVHKALYDELLDHYNKYVLGEEEKIYDFDKYYSFINTNKIFNDSYFYSQSFDSSSLSELLKIYINYNKEN